MATIFLALGSNIGNSQKNIEKAVRLLGTSISGIERAPIYTSKAVGVTDQPDFFNTVLRAQTSLSPQALLVFVKSIEQKVGRVTRFRWGPREIDIDIIFYDDTVLSQPNLTIPHARFRERDFVLQPICDIDPTYIDPVSGQAAGELFDSLPKSERAVLKRISNTA